MIYRFSDGQEIELHYRRKGATPIDSYDEGSLAKLSSLTGLTVTRAHDTTYTDGRRAIWIDGVLPAPFTFAVTGGVMTAQAIVEVLVDEDKPQEIETHRGKQKTLKQIQREIDSEATAAAAFDRMVTDYTEVYGDPDSQEDE